MTCPFCTLPAKRIERENDHAVAILDAYPVSEGHSLIIPRRHILTAFEANSGEWFDLLSLVNEQRLALESRFMPDGYNIGINDGMAAGQTVPHLHIHLIPRYDGDQDDPRGGIRWVLPVKARYWE